MKKYLIDFLVGVLLGIVFIFGPVIGGGDFFLLFSEAFLNVTSHFLALSLFYVGLGIVPFILYVTLPIYKRLHVARDLKNAFFSFISFSLGIYLTISAFLLLVAQATLENIFFF